MDFIEDPQAEADLEDQKLGDELCGEKTCLEQHGHLITAKFTKFPHLPLELRLQIWKSAVFPRLVCFSKVQCDIELRIRLWSHLATQAGQENLLRPRADELSAAVLGVCKESRSEVGRMYRPMFGFEQSLSDTQFESSPQWTYIMDQSIDIKFLQVSEPHHSLESGPKITFRGILFNPDIDTLVLRGSIAAENLLRYCEKDIRDLRFVALYNEDEWKLWRRSSLNIQIKVIILLLFKCPKLERIYLYSRRTLLRHVLDPLVKDNIQEWIEGTKSEMQKGDHDEEKMVSLTLQHNDLNKLYERWKAIAQVKNISFKT